MKRIYKKRKSKALRKQALEQLRETRDMISKNNPDLLEEMRVKLEAAQQMQTAAVKKAPMPEPKVEVEAIDRTKNLEVILKLLSMQPENESLKKELKEFLN